MIWGMWVTKFTMFPIKVKLTKINWMINFNVCFSFKFGTARRPLHLDTTGLSLTPVRPYDYLVTVKNTEKTRWNTKNFDRIKILVVRGGVIPVHVSGLQTSTDVYWSGNDLSSIARVRSIPTEPWWVMPAAHSSVNLLQGVLLIQ